MSSITKKIRHRIKKTLLDRGTEIKIIKHADDKIIYRKNYSEDSIKNRRFYNICAGGHPDLLIEHPYWTNLDLEGASKFKDEKKDLPAVVPYDMLQKQKLPIENDSAEIILSQYSIEHVTDEAADFFFKESYRALKKKGILRVVAPNIELDLRAYLNNDRSYFFWDEWFSDNPLLYGINMPMNKATLEQVFISHFAAHASILHIAENKDKISDIEFRKVLKSSSYEELFDYCISRCKIDIQEKFRYNHINWWSYDKLLKALKNAGFNDAYIAGPLQSSAQILRDNFYFEKKPNFVALTVEAIK